LNVCIVHSDPVIRMTFEDFLESLDHKVITFEHSQEAQRSDSALSELDVFIAGICAPEAKRPCGVADLHARFSDVPIIAVADYGFSVPAEKSVASGVYAYLRPPFHLEDLELLLARICERRNLGELGAEGM